MDNWIFREVKNKYGSSKSGYSGCSTMGCRGEQIRNFGTCIAHLSETQSDQYAERLRQGQEALIFSSCKINATFVQEWVDRICSRSDDGLKTMPADVLMQGASVVGGLRLEQTHWRNLNLTGLTADSVQIGGSVSGRLQLDSAILEGELSIHDIRLEDLSLVACEAEIFWMLKSNVSGSIDARSLKLKKGAHIRESEISGTANFSDATLGIDGYNVTISATFLSSVDFTECNFPRETQIGRYADLPPSRFQGKATFDGATFGSEAFGALLARECSFGGRASFKRVVIFGGVSFDEAQFDQGADFFDLKVKEAPFKPNPLPPPFVTSLLPKEEFPYPYEAFSMKRTQFSSSLSLFASVEGSASIEDVTYAGSAGIFVISTSSELGLGRLNLDSFNVLTLSADEHLFVDQVQMKGGGELQVTCPNLTLTNSTCGAPVLVASAANQGIVGGNATKLDSLAGTNCENLTLSGFDYSQTRFFGAKNLDRLIVEGEFALPSTSGWRTRRKLLAEEISARASTSSLKYWKNFGEVSEIANYYQPELGQLTAIYRALRKGREDQKDEPGSADFYYGEMEMRRCSSPPSSVEQAILTLYWLVSGYGLRAWRALILLALIICATAGALLFFPLGNGDKQPPDFARALLYSVQSGLSLSGSADHYSPPAQVFQLILRIAVPALIALAVLAVRARVKR